MATSYLNRTQSSATSDKIGTFSAWIKVNDAPNLGVFNGHTDSSNRVALYFSETLRIYGAIGGSQSLYFITNRVFRDPSSFYHIVIAWDTTQGTEANRFKIYVNGVQETSFATAVYPPQNADVYWNKGTTSIVGARFVSAIQNHFEGSMSHVHFIDGTAYTPSAFGETDTTTGEWKAKTSPSVTYGNNGFLILKDGNTITDQSSNSNDFTLGAGTLTDLKDNPDNNFATLDPLNVPASNAPTFSNGNTKVVTSTGGNFGGSSNLGASSGKYYFEIKFTAESSSNMGNISLSSSSNARESARTNQHSNQLSASFPNLLYEYDGNVYKDSGSSQGNFGAYAVGDIIIIAMDLDNQKAYFGKNGAWGNSGVPTSGSTGTGAATLSANNDFWHLALGDRNSSATATYEVNFGNGYFGTTAVATNSGNGYAGAEGSSIFNYQPPTGYSALSTKGLNE